MYTLLLLAAAGQAELTDVSVPTAYDKKAYQIKQDWNVNKPVTFKAGTTIGVAEGRTIRLAAPITVVDDPEKISSPSHDVIFYGARGKSWKGVAVARGLTAANIFVLGAETGFNVDNDVVCVLDSCSAVNCSTGVKIARNDGRSRKAPFGTTLKNCWIAGCRKAGIDFDVNTDVEIDSCTIERCPEGLALRQAHKIRLARSRIVGCNTGIVSRWNDIRIEADGNVLANNKVAIAMSSTKDLDFRRTYWGGAPSVQYSKGDVGKVDVSEPLKKLPESGTTIALKKLPRLK
jgi:hypothetical protein